MSVLSREDYYGFDMASLQNYCQINPEMDSEKIIYDLSENQENSIFVEIGTWNGLGSTRRFLLDDVCSIKNKMSREYFLDSSDFELLVENLNSGNEYSFFQKKRLNNEIF